MHRNTVLNCNTHFVLVHCNDHYLGTQNLSWRLAWASFAWTLTMYSQAMTSDQEKNAYSGVLRARTSWDQCHNNTAAGHWSAHSLPAAPWKTLCRHSLHPWMNLHIISYLTLNIIRYLNFFLLEYWKLAAAGNFWVLFIFLALHHMEIQLAHILHIKCHIMFSFKWGPLKFSYTRKPLRCLKATALSNEAEFTELLCNMTWVWKSLVYIFNQ